MEEDKAPTATATPLTLFTLGLYYICRFIYSSNLITLPELAFFRFRTCIKATGTVGIAGLMHLKLL
ncbi:hypothetical protein CFP56_000534 [Quercus suber]|uniref:Uncharacterized protein n=1 Tax=Quercus suber TaxID=58331 RepID=A0AAW0LI74_QUESU